MSKKNYNSFSNLDTKSFLYLKFACDNVNNLPSSCRCSTALFTPVISTCLAIAPIWRRIYRFKFIFIKCNFTLKTTTPFCKQLHSFTRIYWWIFCKLRVAIHQMRFSSEELPKRALAILDDALFNQIIQIIQSIN